MSSNGSDKKSIKTWISLRDIPHEFIITMGNGIEPSDLKLFFDIELSKINPLISCTHIRHFDHPIMWEQLAIELEQMPSKTEARKNNWNGKIPEGYTEHKRKFHRIYILNLPEPLSWTDKQLYRLRKWLRKRNICQ